MTSLLLGIQENIFDLVYHHFTLFGTTTLELCGNLYPGNCMPLNLKEYTMKYMNFQLKTILCLDTGFLTIIK